MNNFSRKIANLVEEGLRRTAVVALLGPRYSGKTTLSREICKKWKGEYLDLEDPSNLDLLAEPKIYFGSKSDKLVVLDEIHKLPEIFDLLRGIIDQGREEGKGKGRFLVLGSAAPSLLNQSEGLTGRIANVGITSLNALEVESDSLSLNDLWNRGGLPGSYYAGNDQDSFKERHKYIINYVQRDFKEFGPRLPANTLWKLWKWIASNQGALLNSSQIGRNIDTGSQTITRYIDLLCDLLIVRSLTPYVANVGKRLVKSPKVYVRDSGMLHSLLGINNYDELLAHQLVGASWEGFVIENLVSLLPFGSFSYFYRTIAGAEIDLIIEHSLDNLWAINIQRSMYAKPSRGFYSALEDLNPEKAFVVYLGEHRYPVADNVEALRLEEMLAELQSRCYDNRQS